MVSSSSTASSLAARQLALDVLQAVSKGGYTDVVLHQQLDRSDLSPQDRQFATELVYGTVRRQRTLDALISQLGKKRAHQQPPDLRQILRLGLYQLRYLDGVPPSAAVNTSVELAKANRLTRLSGVVNGILRQYARLVSSAAPANRGEATAEINSMATTKVDPLDLPKDPITALGIRYSYPDWIVQLWHDQVGLAAAEALCQWFNQVPTLDLRVNRLKQSVAGVQAAFAEQGIAAEPIPGIPDGLRLTRHRGMITELPGYEAGWWSVQDSSAQLVAHLVNPQPGEVVIDACAAPGGKATHLAELMGDTGTVWACDRTPSRLKKIGVNSGRLELTSVQPLETDSRDIAQFHGQADRVLIDAPCSGLGTLHRHADARWRQMPETVRELSELQHDLLNEAARWVKPGGTLVYATCTLHPKENEDQVKTFLEEHPQWRIQFPEPPSVICPWVSQQGWVQIWPHLHHMDGFFMVALTWDESSPNRASDQPDR